MACLRQVCATDAQQMCASVVTDVLELTGRVYKNSKVADVSDPLPRPGLQEGCETLVRKRGFTTAVDGPPLFSL
jgi:hypothetical protein